MLIQRFLEKYEYSRTIKLFIECFGDDKEFLREFYGELDGENECTGTIKDHEITVIENIDGEILAMVHLRPLIAVYEDRKENVSYIMGVATRPDFRHRGFMDKLMKAAEDRIKEKGEGWCFLVPVDKVIYRHLGYVYDWKFNEDEADLLCADDGLTECSAKLLKGDCFEAPLRIAPRAET